MARHTVLGYTILGAFLCQACGGSQEPAKAPDDRGGAEPGGGGPAKRKSGDNVMQPKWTMIEGVGDCKGSILSNYACVPPERPEACGEEAWEELSALRGDDALTPCALEPDIIACTVATKDDPEARCFAKERPAACSDERWERVKDVRLVYPCEGD